jgi:hypothetical protein
VKNGPTAGKRASSVQQDGSSIEKTGSSAVKNDLSTGKRASSAKIKRPSTINERSKTMAKSKATIDERLLAAQTAIDNALSDPSVQGYLAQFGYDAARLQAGRALLARVQELHLKQKAEYGDQYAATDALNAAWKEADAAYMRLLKVARIALKGERGAVERLALDGDRKHSFSGWLAQARQFYGGALGSAEIQTKLAQFGVTQAAMEQAQALVNAAEAASLAQAKERGEAQDATQARDAALDALDDWTGDFVAIARVALEAQPQYLEKLGVVEPS